MDGRASDVQGFSGALANVRLSRKRGRAKLVWAFRMRQGVEPARWEFLGLVCLIRVSALHV